MKKIILLVICILFLSSCISSAKFHAICYEVENPDSVIEFDFGELNIFHANNYALERCENIFNKKTGIYLEVKAKGEN